MIGNGYQLNRLLQTSQLDCHSSAWNFNVEDWWYSGPSFMWQPESYLPKKNHLFITDEEVIDQTFVIIQSACMLQFERMSTVMKCIRVIAYGSVVFATMHEL